MLSVVRSVEVLRCQGVPIDSSERRYVIQGYTVLAYYYILFIVRTHNYLFFNCDILYKVQSSSYQINKLNPQNFRDFTYLQLFCNRIDHILLFHPLPSQKHIFSCRYRERLQRLLVALRGPHAKLQELSAIGSQQDRPSEVYTDTISSDDVEAICSVLKKQRDGLQHLTDILT